MTSRGLAIGIFVVTVAMTIATLVMGYMGAASGAGAEPYLLMTVAVVYVGAGAALVIRLPGNPIGWIVVGIGFFQALNLFASAYSGLSIQPGRSPLPFDQVIAWSGQWNWAPSIGLLVTFLPLLFPDGHLPSRRWRVVGWAAAAAIALQLFALTLGLWPQRGVIAADPQGNTATPTGIYSTLMTIALVLGGLAAIGSIAALVSRFRRATGDERQQLRWFLFAGSVVLAGTVIAFTPLDHSYIGLVIGFFLIPIAILVAMLKYRLYDLDFVIKKTVIYGALAVFITVVYVAIVVGVGAIVGSHLNAALSAVAAAVVALAFQPARRRAQHLADRVVYGKRATPYEVLSEFSDRLSDSLATDDLLPRMARILAEGTAAARADVWLKIGGELRPAATHPPDAAPPSPVDANDLPPEVVPVRHQGELLGGLSVAKSPGDALTPTEGKLIADLASQAGLVLRNARLIEELRASRQRLVKAQDEERRKIERNIHDGAQQQLVALTVKLRLTDSLIEREPAKAHQLMADLQGEATAALEDLRDLARGIYPPLLADKGLKAALESQAKKAAVPTQVLAEDVGRLPQEAEAAVYFCALEAMNNVAKYAAATRATVSLTRSNGNLSFEVADDGSGFDPVGANYGTGLQGMADRLEALGGTLSVRSAPDQGTTVTGTVPVAGGSSGPLP